MSNVATPETTSVPKNVQHERAWIGFLDDSGGKSLSQKGTLEKFAELSNNRRLAGDPMRAPLGCLLDDGQLRAERRKSYEAMHSSTFDFYETHLQADDPKKIETLQLFVGFAEHFDTPLEVPKNNELALKARTLLERKIDSLISAKPPGLVEFEMTFTKLEKSDAYKRVRGWDMTESVTFEARLSQIRSSAASDGYTKSLGSLRALEKAVDLAFKKNTEGRKRVKELEAKRDLLFKTKYHPFINSKSADEQMKLAVRDMWARGNQAISAALEDSGTVPHPKIAEYIEIHDQISKLLDDVKTNPEAAKREAQWRFNCSCIQQDFPGACNAKPTSRTTFEKTKNEVLSAAPPVTQENVDKAKLLAQDLNNALQEVRERWSKGKKEADPLVRFGNQFLATTETTEAHGTLSEEQKTSATAAQEGVDAYDKALDQAKQRDYVAALESLEVVKGKLKDLKDGVASAIEDMPPPSTTEIEERGKIFKSQLGVEDDKGNLRFNDEAMNIILAGAITLDSEGEYAFSDEAKAIIDLQLKTLADWRKLVAKGVNPVTAGEHVFKGIPLEFWPPEAVRVIAMFRKAEAEFESEQAEKELEDEIAQGFLSKAAKATDEFLSGTLMTEAGELVDTVSSTIVGKITIDLTKKVKLENPNLTEKEIEEKVGDLLEKCDVAKAAEVLGKVAGGLSALNNFIAGGKAAWEVGKKKAEIEFLREAVEGGTESPVKLRMAEFERNRAVWTMINSNIDAIAGVGGLAGEIPGLDLGLASKDMVLAIQQAYHFFSMLREASKLKRGAKYDPETMMNLALAEEAERAGILGSQKTFDAVENLLKVIAGGLELGGVTAGAGFALKGVSNVLHYGAKGFFSIREWREASKLKVQLNLARSYPVNIEAVEYVFSKSSKFARFALADGALNGDSWAKRWVLGRGLTDTDLDNPNTSTGIIREYLNVTFQGVTGETEEDNERDETFKEKFTRTKKDKPPFYDWQASNALISISAWNTNLTSALKTGSLKNDKKAVKAITSTLEAFDKADSEFTLSLSKFEKSFEEFSKAVNKPATSEELTTAANLAQLDLTSAKSSCMVARSCLGDISTASRSWRPLAKSGAAHKAMELYLSSLAETAMRQEGPFIDFQDQYNYYITALTVKKVAPDEVRDEARKLFETEFDKSKDDIKNYKLKIAEFATNYWNTTKLKNALTKKPGSVDEIVTAAKTSWSLEDAQVIELTKEINAAAKSNRDSKIIECYGLLLKWIQNKDQALQSASTSGKDLQKVEEQATAELKRQCEELAKAGIADFERELIKILSKYRKPGTGQTDFVPIRTKELSRAGWKANKELALKGGLKFQKSGVGPALDNWNAVDKSWKMLPGDEHFQADWRSAWKALQNAVKAMPLSTTEGLQLTGMKSYQTDLLDELQARWDQFKKECEKADKSEDDKGEQTEKGWRASGAALARWPINRAGWQAYCRICELHGWDAPLLRQSYAEKFFGYVEDALKAHQDATSPETKNDLTKACKKLQKEIISWKNLGGVKKNKKVKKDFAGMAAFQAAIKGRLDNVDALIEQFGRGWSS